METEVQGIPTEVLETKSDEMETSLVAASPSAEPHVSEDGVEVESKSEQQSPADHLHDILNTPFVELRRLAVEDIQAYEAELVQTMHENAQSARTFKQIAEGFRPPVQKKLRDPQVVIEHTLDHIVQLRRQCHEHFAKEQLAFEKLERERIAAEEIAAHQRRIEALHLREAAERNEALALIEKANEYGEQQFAAWNLLRQPLDSRGYPRELHPDDQALVDKIEARQREQVASGRTFSQTTARMEQSFAGWVHFYEIFGTGVVEDVGPVTKFDDVARHIDVGVRHHIPGVERGLAIDFTINGNDIDLARKLRHGIENPVVRTKYATPRFSGGEHFIPIVIALDDHRAERLMYQTNIAAVAKPDNPIHRQLIQATNLNAQRHHDQEILQYTVVEEALEQIRFQLETMEKNGVDPTFTADHRTLVTYFTALLEKRKDLRDIATTEAEKPDVQRVYRVRDVAFIRSVAAA